MRQTNDKDESAPVQHTVSGGTVEQQSDGCARKEIERMRVQLIFGDANWARRDRRFDYSVEI